jgi:heptosyltransferase-2
MHKPKKILLIQTAFIGDVILATSLIEHLNLIFPDSQIDFLLRAGNQSLIETHPKIKKIYVWEKKKKKIRSLIENLKEIRSENYDVVINIQRFFSSGLITSLSKAKIKIGFDKNPLSLFFTHKITHKIPHQQNEVFLHEVQRNCLLTRPITESFSLPEPKEIKPKLYFSTIDEEKVDNIVTNRKEYFVLAPSSVWYTKQWHSSKWSELILQLEKMGTVFIIGGPDDKEYLETVIPKDSNTINLSGKLSLRQSALLMKNAKRVFVNDSAPLHLASSVNAKTTAIFCSTVPDFGYFPLSDNSKLVQLTPRLDCMPCGLHGHKDCPKSHFKCSQDIKIKTVLDTI